MLKKLIITLSVVSLSLMFLLTFGVIKLLQNQSGLKNVLASLQGNIKNINTSVHKTIENKIPSQNKIDFEITGVLRKEKIDESLELGSEYWYVLYFDEPFLVEENSSGHPMYDKSIQVQKGEKADLVDLEKFVNKRVRIAGNLTWGYSESRVINVLAISDY